MTKDKDVKMEEKKEIKEKANTTAGNKRYSFPLVYIIAGLVLLVVLSILIYCFIVSK